MLVRRLDEHHDMTFGRGLVNYARDAESVRQRVDTRLQTLQEEWFLDTSAGVPYLQEVMVKPANVPYAIALVKRCILETDGVESIVSFSADYDGNTRFVKMSVVVRTIYGDLSVLVGKPRRPPAAGMPPDALLTEDRDAILTETGAYILVEYL